MYKTIVFSILFLAIFTLSCSNGTKENKISEEISSAEKQEVNNNPLDLKPIYLTTASFKEQVWDYEANPEAWVYKGDLPCIVDFYADWCKPCKMVAPIMDDLADYYKDKLIIYKVNTDEQKELATVFQVRSIPAILFAPMEGKPAMQPGALSKEEYIKIIDEFIFKTKENEKKQS
ncbi:MAG: thioredoxin fold domain-containing protein [Bacteroidales bacterium]|nr:thioredoxin fold domain-containing protein [Bacteroidales bacterium]MCF8404962.1 thioredoxin fold domain-containing protein [Bacteroidales bacterium]